MNVLAAALGLLACAAACTLIALAITRWRPSAASTPAAGAARRLRAHIDRQLAEIDRWQSRCPGCGRLGDLDTEGGP